MLRLSLALLVSMAISFHLNQPALAQGEVVPVAEQARAVFKKRCVSCHSQSQARGGLDMTSLEAILAGSTSGSVVQPGNPAESLVFTLAAHLDTPKMPPNANKIPEKELKSISAWIESLGTGSANSLEKNAMVSAHMESSTKAPSSMDGLVGVEPASGPVCITALACFGSTLAVSGLHQVLLYDTQSGKWQGALNFPEGDVFALKFSPDGTRLIAAGGVGGLSGAVVSWDVKTFRRQQMIAIDDEVVLAMDVSPDGQAVAVAGPKRIVEVIDLSSGVRKHVMKKHADWVTSLAFSSDGVFLASGDRFGSVYIWELADGTQFDTIENHGGMVTALQFSPDSNHLWSAGRDGQVKQWDLQRSQVMNRWNLPEASLSDMQIVKDDCWVIDNRNRLWALDSSGQAHLHASFATDVTRIAIGHSAPRSMVVGDSRSGLYLVDLARSADSAIHLPTHAVTLPQKISEHKPVRLAPKPVERQLQVVKAPDADIATAPLSTGSEPGKSAALLQLKRTLEDSKRLLEQVQQNLSQLEEQIAELERDANH